MNKLNRQAVKANKKGHHPSLLLFSPFAGGEETAISSTASTVMLKQSIGDELDQEIGSSQLIAQIMDKKKTYPCTFQFCVLCEKNVHSSKLPCHVRQCHVAKPMFRCPACDFTSTYSKNNVKSHMVSLHGLAGDPISYMEQYAVQVEDYMRKCFPHVRGRGRPMVVQSPSSSADSSPTLQPSSPGLPSTPRRSVVNGSRSRFRNLMHHNSSPSFDDRLSALPALKACDLLTNGALAELQKQAMNCLFGDSELAVSPYNQSATVDVSSISAIKMEEIACGFSGGDGDQQMNGQSDSSSAYEVSHATSTDSWLKDIANTQQSDIASASQCVTQPKYLPHQLNWTVLNEDQVKGTVFDMFNPSSIVERLDLAKFESLVVDNRFLSQSQIDQIAAIRRQLNLQSFEIMFAVHRLDLTVLSAEHVDLVSSLVPSEADVNRFRCFEQSNQISALSDDEQFIIQLSKIERLEAKLQVMAHMGHFSQRLRTANQVCSHIDSTGCQQLLDLTTAAKALRTCNEFHRILQLLLTCANLIVGDFNASMVKGFRSSTLIELSTFTFPDRPQSLTLLQVVAETISRQFPELQKFHELCHVLDRASKVDWDKLVNTKRQLELGHQKVIYESNQAVNPLLTDFLASTESKIRDLSNNLQTTQDSLKSCLLFFGEPAGAPLQPADFFSKITAFCRSLQKAHIDLHL